MDWLGVWSVPNVANVVNEQSLQKGLVLAKNVTHCDTVQAVNHLGQWFGNLPVDAIGMSQKKQMKHNETVRPRQIHTPNLLFNGTWIWHLQIAN